MTEYTTNYQVVSAGLGLVIASALYSWGGRGRTTKLWRRIGSAFILGLIFNLLTLVREIWSAWFLLIPLLLFGGFSLGYGSDYFETKLLKRTVYALAIIFSGVVVCIIMQAGWWILIPHAGIGLWSIYLGIKSIIETPAEEFFICMILNLGLLMYPFIGK